MALSMSAWYKAKHHTADVVFCNGCVLDLLTYMLNITQARHGDGFLLRDDEVVE